VGKHRRRDLRTVGSKVLTVDRTFPKEINTCADKLADAQLRSPERERDQRNSDLDPHGVLGGAKEFLDPQRLFDPADETSRLPQRSLWTSAVFLYQGLRMSVRGHKTLPDRDTHLCLTHLVGEGTAAVFGLARRQVGSGGQDRAGPGGTGCVQVTVRWICPSLDGDEAELGFVKRGPP
jgi:hypothetical protein